MKENVVATSTKTQNGKPAGDGPKRRTDFPKHPLEEALACPRALQRNGGQPLDAIGMATALGRSPGSGRFRVLTAASGAYGLTGGSYKAQFRMLELGRAIVEPTSPAEAAQSLVTAALTPPLFKNIYDYYRGKKFPETQFFVNTIVREFGVAADQAERCVEIFTENMRFVGLIKDTPGGEWLAAEPAAAPTGTDVLEEAGLEASDLPGDEGELPPVNDAGSSAPPPVVAEEPPRKARPTHLFVGHGKNKKPLQQLTKTLENLGIPYLVAEEEAHMGRPISQKVRETMEQCGAAILVFSADEEYYDKDGNTVWKPSENVSHELGAASVMYGDRVILFKEEAVQLASNYSGIGYIEFEKNQLDAKVNDLLRELVALRILKLSVGD